MLCKLHLDLIEVAECIIQNRLLALPLPLALLRVLLLLLSLLSALWQRHEQTSLHLLNTWPLRLCRRLNRPACEDVGWATGSTERDWRLWASWIG